MNKIVIPENIDARTYYDYLKLGDVNTKHYLMIAELIDNSISSFENKYGNLDWNEKLQISLEINFEGNEKEIHGHNVLNNTFIRFTDNGYGMDDSELKRSVKLNNTKRSNSKMNVHGRGLKQCAFYFGVDLTINTNNGLGAWKIEQKLSSQESDNSIYYINPEKGAKTERGTEVLIENINSNKIFSSSTWSKIVEALSFRYIKYLEAQKMEINYKFNNESPDFFRVPNEPKITVGQAFEVIEFSDSDFEKFVSGVKQNITKSRKNSAEPLDKNVVSITTDTIESLLRTARSKNDIPFEFYVDLSIAGNKLKTLFWMLPSKQKPFRGVRLFEGLRAINHPGFQEHETKPYMNWKHEKVASGSTENRFAGMCDLSILGVKSKTDKSSFSMPDQMIEELNTQIFSVWFVFDKFTMHARKEAKYEPGQKPGKAQDDALANVSTTKFNNKKIEYQIENSSNDVKVFTYNSLADNIWKISVKINPRPKPFDIFIKDPFWDEKEYSITVNTGHAFWNNIHKLKEDFFIEAVYPITLLLVTQHIEIEESNGSGQSDPMDLINVSGEIFNV